MIHTLSLVWKDSVEKLITDHREDRDAETVMKINSKCHEIHRNIQ